MKAVKYLPTFLFVGFIFTMMVLWLVLPKDSYSPQEKRTLAAFPECNTETLTDGTFQKSLDTWLSDHMPARSFFVGLNADYDLLSGRNGAKGIYLGQDNYLFPKPVQDGETLLKNAGYIQEFADDLDNIPVYMTVVPSSGAVNSDKLPAVHETYRDAEWITAFREKLGKNVRFVDVQQDFAKAAAKRQLYYKTDHHWTSYGAFECYRLLGAAMGYTPLAERDFDKEKVKGFYGTSYAKAALWFLPPDTVELWSNHQQPDDAVTVAIHDGQDNKTGSSYFFREQLKNDDKYPVFLDGNHSLVRITNTAAEGGTLIVIKDSYAHTLVPFLSQHYRNIVMVDLRYYKKEVSALVDRKSVV